MSARIDYQVQLTNPETHRFKVTLRISKAEAEQVLSLPVWIPGSYLVREFARNLSPLQAFEGEQAIEVTPLDKSTWRLGNAGQRNVTVQYEVYANDTSVRTAFLDTRRGFFNGTSVCLRVHGREGAPHGLKLSDAPKGWNVATALKPVKVNAHGWGTYEAANYDELIDHPVELGDFWQGEFSIRGVRHQWVVAGAPADLDGQKLLDDSRRICEAQMQFWHGRRKPPFDHYVFMLNAVEDGYGGLEHRQSTALICSRKDLPRVGRPAPQDAYTTLLGLISHEYFHTWNVKRLKPTEFAPYDLTRENHTRMLWFFEGFTSYYDDQFLLRTGLLDAKGYLKLLGRTVNQVQATPGRHHFSVAQASFDAWTRYYRPDENTANATVNYYTKGAMVALCLDLALRCVPAGTDVTGGVQPTLDGVMRRLWALGRPIAHEDVAQALAEEARGVAPPAWAQQSVRGTRDADWTRVLNAWTEETGELPLREALAVLGVQWRSQAAPLPQRLGVRLKAQDGQLKVQAVMRDSVAEGLGLSAGDEVLALDDWRLRTADDLVLWHQPTVKQTLLVCRDGRLMRLTLQPLEAKGAAPYAPAELIALDLDATAASTTEHGQRRLSWLMA